MGSAVSTDYYEVRRGAKGTVVGPDGDCVSSEERLQVRFLGPLAPDKRIIVQLTDISRNPDLSATPSSPALIGSDHGYTKTQCKSECDASKKCKSFVYHAAIALCPLVARFPSCGRGPGGIGRGCLANAGDRCRCLQGDQASLAGKRTLCQNARKGEGLQLVRFTCMHAGPPRERRLCDRHRLDILPRGPVPARPFCLGVQALSRWPFPPPPPTTRQAVCPVPPTHAAASPALAPTARADLAATTPKVRSRGLSPARPRRRLGTFFLRCWHCAPTLPVYVPGAVGSRVETKQGQRDAAQTSTAEAAGHPQEVNGYDYYM